MKQHIYPRVMLELKRTGVLNDSDAVLVLAGGNFDRQSMLDAQLRNVTISNLEYHAGHSDYSPFPWARLDAEMLDISDDSYDWAVIHAGLHHLAVPAKGICEMLRVARKGIVCFEARDSVLMKLAVRFGITTDYELDSAHLTGGAVGGYRNGPIPNYIYRWTEREFEKVVNSYAPSHLHDFFYYYGLRVPSQRFAMERSVVYRSIGKAIDMAGDVLETVVPKQGNQFAFGVLKKSARQPWLFEDLSFRAEYLAKRYDKTKYGDPKKQ
jgi:SAM-dependent methyltransferase